MRIKSNIEGQLKLRRSPETENLRRRGAAGEKLSQTATENGNTKTTDYSGGFVYENGALQFILTAEGRVTMRGGNPVYEYFMKDHLGNTRLTFTTQPETLTELAHLAQVLGRREGMCGTCA